MGRKTNEQKLLELEKTKNEKSAIEKIKKNLLEENKTEIENVNRCIGTGCTILDLINGGGFPVGKIINIVGDNSTGKTLFAIEFIANAKKKLGSKLNFFYDDVESGFSFDSKKIYGFDIIKEDQHLSKTIDDVEFNLNKLINSKKKDEILIYVIDSLDALSSKEELERDEEKLSAMDNGKEFNAGTYGMERQKRLSEFLRINNQKIKENNCILIIISQVRENIGVTFGSKYKRTGGKSLDFYASIVLWLAESEKIKIKETSVGAIIKIKNTKNKIGKPFRQGFATILFDYGIDDISSNLNYYFDLLTPLGKEKCKKIEIEWINDKFVNKDNLIKFIEQNHQEQLLRELAIKKWEDFEKEISVDRKGKY